MILVNYKLFKCWAYTVWKKLKFYLKFPEYEKIVILYNKVLEFIQNVKQKIVYLKKNVGILFINLLFKKRGLLHNKK